LGAKAFTHPNLLLLTQAEFANVDPSKPKESVDREDQIKIICAKCRQKIVSADGFRGCPRLPGRSGSGRLPSVPHLAIMSRGAIREIFRVLGVAVQDAFPIIEEEPNPKE